MSRRADTSLLSLGLVLAILPGPMFAAIGWAFLLHGRERVLPILLALGGPAATAWIVWRMLRKAEDFDPEGRAFLRRGTWIVLALALLGAGWLFRIVRADQLRPGSRPAPAKGN